jgi:hypothetical protein
MSYNGNEGEVITLTVASQMTQNYRDQAGLNPTLSHYAGKNKIQSILDQDGCVGIRTYYAISENGEKQLVFVGVDSEENDLYNGILVDKSIICPPFCPRKNPLNSND